MIYSVWLNECMGAGNARSLKALNLFGSAENIYKASYNDRQSCGIFTKSELDKLRKFTLKDADKIITDCNNTGISIIRLSDENYPKALSVTDNPPVVLYVKGTLPDFNRLPSLTIVGPRKISDFGKKAAYSLSFRLARAGFIIVSGGALGCDTFAHAGAIKGEGATVLVMGCGINSGYLAANSELRDSVAAHGCLLSEYSPNKTASKYTFPVRNRIMAALSQGTVVIEAGVKSGALITARYACEWGRDVFVIPGSTEKPEYKGSNALLRDGAAALLDLSDIFNEYIARFPDKINIEHAYDTRIISRPEQKNISEHPEKVIQDTAKKIPVSKKFNESLSKEAKIVYNCLDKQKFLPEEIKNTGLTAGEILAALTELEMESVVRAVPGGMYEVCE